MPAGQNHSELRSSSETEHAFNAKTVHAALEGAPAESDGPHILTRALGRESDVTRRVQSFQRAQRTFGNAYVQRLMSKTIAQGRGSPRGLGGSISTESAGLIHREETPPPKSPAERAQKLVDDNTTLALYQDDAAIAAAVLPTLPADEDFAIEVLNRVNSNNKDDIALGLTKGSAGKLGALSRRLKMRLIEELASGVVAEDEEAMIGSLWMSFDTAGDYKGLGEVAALYPALWQKSLDESDALQAYLKGLYEGFENDVQDLALQYLSQNKTLIEAESRRYGLELNASEGDPKGGPEADQQHLKEMKLVASRVLEIKNKRQELLEIPVGYDDGGDGQPKVAVKFKPKSPPKYSIEEIEKKPGAAYDKVNEQWTRASALISGFANTYPTVYTLLQQDRLDEFVKGGDASKSQSVIKDVLGKTYQKAEEAEVKISWGNAITPYDLVMLHSQVLGNKKVPGVNYHFDWTQPFLQESVNKHTKTQASSEFWEQLGLSLATAAALIAAPFTGGVTAMILVSGVVAVEAAQAAASWEKYADLKTVGQSAVNDELALVSEGQIDSAFTDAAMNSLVAFLDVFGARATVKSAEELANLVKAADTAEGALKAAAERNKLIRQGVKEAGLNVAGAGVAVGAHEIAENIPSLQMAPVGVLTFKIPEPKGKTATNGASVNPLRIERAPFDDGGMYERYIRSGALTGDYGLERSTYVINPQFNARNLDKPGVNGFDLFGVSVFPERREVKLCKYECKYVSPGGEAKLSERAAAGMQLSPGWEHYAASNFLDAPHPSVVQERVNLFRIVQEATGVSHTRESMLNLILSGERRIVTPNWALLDTLNTQVRTLLRMNQEARIITTPVPFTPVVRRK
ncbi:MAG: hypothetical protein AB7T32_14075 [Dehalococcoidia bacterium]